MFSCNNIIGEWILGDSAYPILPYLLTPYRDNGHLTVSKKNFNKKLSSCRVSVEHSFGMLKERFRQLYHVKLLGIQRICYFIRAVCVLHNWACGDGLRFEDPSIDDDQPPTEHCCFGADLAGSAVRDQVCERLYLNRTR